jgi:hypothetical protein
MAARKKSDNDTAKDETPSPKAYISETDVYTAGKFTKAGDVFVTEADANDDWTEVDPATRNIIDASTQKVPADVPLDQMSDEALQGMAASKHVNTDGMDREQLITAIKAVNEPHL